MKKYNYFISHSQRDADFVHRLMGDLKNSGIADVFAPSEITPGTDYSDAISQALNNANAVLVVVSKHSLTSHDILDEIEFATSKGKKIIPVLIEKVDHLPFHLRRFQFIDFTENYESALTHLRSSLRNISEATEPRFQSAPVPAPAPTVPMPSRPLGKSFSVKKWLSGLFKKEVHSKDLGKEIPPGSTNVEDVLKELANEPVDEKPVESDLVKCSVFAPSSAKLSEHIMVQVFAHLQSDDKKVKDLATQFDETADLRATKQLNEEVSHGSKLVFCLSMPGVEIDEPVQSLIWRGDSEAVQFGVRIPDQRGTGKLVGTVYVTQDSIPFGHVKFLLTVVDPVNDQPEVKEPTTDTWKRYRYAFISYASADRDEVLKRVQMLARFHIHFFQDLLTLEPGERWQNKLYEEINKSDVFFLFWSNAAKNSEWVMTEVRYALDRQKNMLFGLPEIVPVIIEGPPPVLPPPELKDIHFNDPFLYFINAGSSSR